MLEFIQLLKQRYQSISLLLSHEADKNRYQQKIEQLLLAEAFVRKGQLLDNRSTEPLQIAVIGPTQAGKSSIVNLLLAGQSAGVSPLAGYTIHAQGFCHNININDCSSLQRYFGRFQQLPLEQLSKDRHDCYSLTATLGNSAILPPCVLWDTPDFDSIDSATYREGVLRAIALADVIILVVSKEKYADQSVWDMMSILADLHQPTLICLNKLVQGSEQIVINSLTEKWRQVRSDVFPDVVPLYYQKTTGRPEWPTNQQHLLTQLASKVIHHQHQRFEQELLKKHWQNWLEPVLAEHQALHDWHALIDQVIEQALLSYQRDYLNHPHHYETFQYALAELLNLLEIPGMAGILASTRKILTWPIKQLMKLGRKRLHLADTSHEMALLNQIAEHMLIQLADKLMDKTEQSRQGQWWKEANTLLRSQRTELIQDFNSAAKTYHIAFQQDVENAANRLYKKLQEQPLVLNGLRATRVTTDAAGIALALHTGGIGMHDLIIAPAMLTVTSLLTESAMGGYMHKVELELKQQQLQTVKQQVFMNSFRAKLLKLPEQLSGKTHFNITPEQLQTAAAQLTEKQHGLRLL
ncbi:MAG: GTPase domain-containing protein [Methylococcales bacterium]